jgi:hypothetical protein
MGNGLALHAQHRGGRERLARSVVLDNVFDGAKLTRLHSALELLPHLSKCSLPHSTVERRFQNVAPVCNRRPLENMIAGVSHGPLRRLLGRVVVLLALLLSMPPRLGHYLVSLMPMLCGQLTVPP